MFSDLPKIKTPEEAEIEMRTVGFESEAAAKTEAMARAKSRLNLEMLQAEKDQPLRQAKEGLKRIWGDYLLRKHLTLWGGAGGSGKTTTISGLMQAIPAQHSFLDVPCHEQVSTAFFNLEDGKSSLDRKYDAYAVRNGWSASVFRNADGEPMTPYRFGADDLERLFGVQSFTLVHMASTPGIYGSSGVAVNWEAYYGLQAFIEETKVGVFSVDPVIRMMRGVPLTNESIGQLAFALTDLAISMDIAALAAVHTRKRMGIAQHRQDAADFKGGTELPDAARVGIIQQDLIGKQRKQYEAAGVEPEELRDLRSISVVKTNVGKQGDGFVGRLSGQSVTNLDGSTEEQAIMERWQPPHVHSLANTVLWPFIRDALNDPDNFVTLNHTSQAKNSGVMLIEAAAADSAIAVDAKKTQEAMIGAGWLTSKKDQNSKRETKDRLVLGDIDPLDNAVSEHELDEESGVGFDAFF